MMCQWRYHSGGDGQGALAGRRALTCGRPLFVTTGSTSLAVQSTV